MERVVLLKVIDAKWMDHIDDMDQLRQGIGLQAYGQRDPKVEYKMLGYQMFDDMTKSIEADTIRTLFHIKLEQKVEREQVAKVTGTNKDEFGRPGAEEAGGEEDLPQRSLPLRKRKEIQAVLRAQTERLAAAQHTVIQDRKR